MNSDFYLNKARESFDRESIIYENKYNSVEELYGAFIDETNEGFNDYQDFLRKKFYGRSERLAEYLSDNNVINEIISVGTIKIKDVIKNIITNNDVSYQDIKPEYSGKNITKYISKQQVSERNLDLATSIAKEISSYLKQNIAGQIFDETFEEGIKQALYKEFEQHKYRVNIPGQRDSITVSNIDDYQVKKVLFNQDELKDIIRLATSSKLSQKGINYTVGVSTIEIALRDKFQQSRIDKDDTNAIQNNIPMIVDTFIEVVRKAIIKVHPKEKNNVVISQNIRNRMINLFSDTHLVNEIYKANTPTAVSGTIGEIFFAIFLKFATGKQVQILGQQQTSSGSAAVDVVMIKNKLTKLGFQIKNYSANSNGIVVLYDQSNKVYNDNSINRYINNQNLQLLQQWDLTSFYQKAPVKEDNLVNLLEKAVPNYIRYDQADTNNIEVNNFYIIKTSFIPASVIFYHIYHEKLSVESMFFFSKEKREPQRNQLLNDEGNLLSSWSKVRNGFDSNVNEWQNLLWLNFRGMSIKFDKSFGLKFYNESK